MSRTRFWILNAGGCLGLLLAVSARGFAAADTNSPPAEADASAASASNTTSDDVLRAYLQLQEQIHATQLAIERNRQETETAAARNADALASRLQFVEKSLADLSAQRVNELKDIQRENHTLLIVVGAFAALGFLAVLFTAYFQWRAVNRLMEISPALPAGRALGPPPAVAALGDGENQLVSLGPAGQSNVRLLGALERLEKRILELEHGTASPPANGAPASDNPGAAGQAAQSSSLLGKGQSLLNLDKADEAIACFDEVLAADPDNAEALVKKGTALERLRKPQEAIECYDRAIAADSSMTIAYLYKGGLYNRLERFNEALECYEKALRTQEKRPAS